MVTAFAWVIYGIGCTMTGWCLRALFDIQQRRIERNKQRGMQE